MTQHSGIIEAIGGDVRPLVWGEENGAGNFTRTFRVPGTAGGKKFEIVWSDEGSGEIRVSREWNYRATPAAKDDAMAKADALAGRTVNWLFIEAY
jgi:hypothetical protein